MNKIDLAIRELHRSENDLAGELLRASDRHKADHEIFHLGRDLARWSQEHVEVLSRVGRDYGLELSPRSEDDSGPLSTVRQRAGDLLGRRPEPGFLLLRDLREIHRMAAGTSLDWEVLAQAAQALKDRELLAVATTCHPETLRQMRWANAKLKESAAQVLVS